MILRHSAVIEHLQHAAESFRIARARREFIEHEILIHHKHIHIVGRSAVQISQTFGLAGPVADGENHHIGQIGKAVEVLIGHRRNHLGLRQRRSLVPRHIIACSGIGIAPDNT